MATKKRGKKTAKQRTYTTESGVVLKLRPIPQLLLARVFNNPRDPVPQAPQKRIEEAIGEQYFSDYEDPDYVKDLEAWEQRQQATLMNLCTSYGVASYPGDDDPTLQILKSTFPRESREELKALWVAAHIGDDELEQFIEAVISQTIPTEAGLAEARERFRDSDQRGVGPGLPAEESPESQD